MVSQAVYYGVPAACDTHMVDGWQRLYKVDGAGCFSRLFTGNDRHVASLKKAAKIGDLFRLLTGARGSKHIQGLSINLAPINIILNYFIIARGLLPQLFFLPSSQDQRFRFSQRTPGFGLDLVSTKQRPEIS